MNDSVYAHMATQEAERMKAMYDYTRYQEQAQVANMKSEKMRSKLMLISFITLCIIAITIIAVQRERKKRKAALIQYKRSIAELAKVQSEVIKLRSHGKNIEIALSVAQDNIEELNNYNADMNLLIEKKEKEIEQLQNWIQRSQNRKSQELHIAETRLKESEVYQTFDKLAASAGRSAPCGW